VSEALSPRCQEILSGVSGSVTAEQRSIAFLRSSSNTALEKDSVMTVFATHNSKYEHMPMFYLI